MEALLEALETIPRRKKRGLRRIRTMALLEAVPEVSLLAIDG